MCATESFGSRDVTMADVRCSATKLGVATLALVACAFSALAGCSSQDDAAAKAVCGISGKALIAKALGSTAYSTTGAGPKAPPIGCQFTPKPQGPSEPQLSVSAASTTEKADFWKSTLANEATTYFCDNTYTGDPGYGYVCDETAQGYVEVELWADGNLIQVRLQNLTPDSKVAKHAKANSQAIAEDMAQTLAAAASATPTAK
jgi:hypothetical protein